MAHKTVNWTAIKARYLKGQKPKDIAPEYGLTAKQVSDKATKEGWVRKKSEIFSKIEDIVLSDVEEIYSLYGSMIKDTAKKIEAARRSNLIGLTVQDGEGFVNKFAEHDHKAGLAIYLEKIKHKNKLELAELAQQDPDDDIEPGFNISVDA